MRRKSEENRRIRQRWKVNATLLWQKPASAIRWPNGVLITDEPENLGGKDWVSDPYTLLLSSQVSCALATLRMYIEHKASTDLSI